MRLLACALLISACNFPKPEAAPTDASGSTDATPVDANIPPGVSIHVSGTGDDANDGLSKPVKTLKHALGLAAANPDITSIVLASGRYTSDSGETFPYTVPANLTLLGPAGGGAVLAGSNAEPGLVLTDGTLTDLELEDFTFAVTTKGTATLANLRITTKTTAVSAETTSQLTVRNTTIVGTAGACASGIVLNGASQLAVNGLTTLRLGTAAIAKDDSILKIVGASLTGDPGCTQTTLIAESGHAFDVTDSTLDGGKDGIMISPRSGALKMHLTNTIVRNYKNNAMSGGSGYGGTVELRVDGGELSGNTRGGAEIAGVGLFSFSNVAIKRNGLMGIYFQDGDLVVRGCTIIDNPGVGISLLTPRTADLGTVASPGNNTFRNNQSGSVGHGGGIATIEAVGNIWAAGVQGADSNGKYATPALIQGPVSFMSYCNYSLSCDPGQCSIRR